MLECLQVVKAKEVKQDNLRGEEEGQGMVHLTEAGRRQQISSKGKGQVNPQKERPGICPQNAEQIGHDQEEKGNLETQSAPLHIRLRSSNED